LSRLNVSQALIGLALISLMIIALPLVGSCTSQKTEQVTVPDPFAIVPPVFPKPTPVGTPIPPLTTASEAPVGRNLPEMIVDIHPAPLSHLALTDFYGVCVSFEPKFLKEVSYSRLRLSFERGLNLMVNNHPLSLGYGDLLEVEVNAGIGPICRMVPPIRERICWPANLMAGQYEARLQFVQADGVGEYVWYFTLTE